MVAACAGRAGLCSEEEDFAIRIEKKRLLCYRAGLYRSSLCRTRRPVPAEAACAGQGGLCSEEEDFQSELKKRDFYATGPGIT